MPVSIELLAVGELDQPALRRAAEEYARRLGRYARVSQRRVPGEPVPAYIEEEVEAITLPETATLPEKPKWTTLFIAAGKKDKVNKVDIVGFLAQKGELKKEDIGLIEVKDFYSFVAIRRSKASHVLNQIKNEKIKNLKVKIDVAR